MPDMSRQRLAHVLEDPDCDLAEAALLCCVEIEPDLDVDAELARLDAMAAELHAATDVPADAHTNAHALASFLAGTYGFTGDVAGYHDPRNGLLTNVLDRRRGLPITLAIVYVAIARRVGIHAHGINAPGHFLVGVGGAAGRSSAENKPAEGGSEEDEPGEPDPLDVARDIVEPDVIVLDPFYDGALLSEDDIRARVEQATGDPAAFDAGHLLATPPVVVIRRLLNNLTRDFLNQGDAEDALWTVELKRALPDTGPDDVDSLARILMQLGRYRDAGDAVDAYLAEEAPAVGDHTSLEALSRQARAQLN